MTARYFPASMSLLEEEHVLIRVAGNGNSTFLLPIRAVSSAMGPVAPSQGPPPGTGTPYDVGVVRPEETACRTFPSAPSITSAWL